MRTAWLLIVAAALSAPVGAETLSVHKAKATAAISEKGYPTKGQRSGQVVARFGEPVKKHPPVGGDAPRHPAITRWDYEGFSVFFDAGTVIDTVIYDQPAPVTDNGELKPAS